MTTFLDMIFGFKYDQEIGNNQLEQVFDIVK